MKTNVRNFNVTSIKFFWIISLAIFFVSFISPAKVVAQDTKANFTGTWVTNAAKSTQSEGNFRGAKQLTVKQEENILNVERLRAGRDGQDMTSKEKITLDGKECVNDSGRGASKSVATWSVDGKTLTIATTRSMERNGTKMEMKSSEAWSLTDAKTLTILSISQAPNGERKITLVYDLK